jgi:RES domain-containing protein
MRVFRLCRQRYAELTGFGAKKTGGRWNRRGIAALYAAENASLTVLEVLVHLDRGELPMDYVLLEISVPDLGLVYIADQRDERLESLYQDGPLRLGEGSIGFSVPSFVVPQDRVVVLYPEIAGASLAIERMTPFAFDRRLFFPPRNSGLVQS